MKCFDKIFDHYYGVSYKIYNYNKIYVKLNYYI